MIPNGISADIVKSGMTSSFQDDVMGSNPIGRLGEEMSKSWKKASVHSVACARSDKEYKVRRNRKERRGVRQKIHVGDVELLAHEQVPYDDWDTPKDGKKYFSIREVIERDGIRYLRRLIGK